MAQALHKVGRVKYQPFLKYSSHWQWALNDFQGKHLLCRIQFPGTNTFY